MALSNDDPSSTEESRPSTLTPTSSTMKIPHILRRSSTVEASEKQKEKDMRRGSMPEPERKSSLSALPLRLRRRKTQPINELNEEETEAASKLGQLFFSLPTEIITQIVTYLSIRDVFHLRLSTRVFNEIFNDNASPIIRAILHESLAPTTTDYIQPKLYPMPLPCTNLSHLFTMLRRQSLVDREIYNLLAFVQMKIYMTRTAARVLSVSDNRQRLIEAFQRPAWFVTHFLESYRNILVFEHPTHETMAPNCSSCHKCREAAQRVVDAYPDDDIMPAYHFYQLALEHLQIATRTPVAAGPLERRLRGWGKQPVAETALNMYVILGGIPELRKIAMMQGSYTSRIGFLTEFVEKVREAVNINSILLGDGMQLMRSTIRSGDDKGIPQDFISPLSPPFQYLNQAHITSLPDVTRFFYDIWKDRILSCALDKEDIIEPYSWLQRVMSGSGVEFGQSRTPEPPLALGASPL